MYIRFYKSYGLECQNVVTWLEDQMQVINTPYYTYCQTNEFQCNNGGCVPAKKVNWWILGKDFSLKIVKIFLGTGLWWSLGLCRWIRRNQSLLSKNRTIWAQQWEWFWHYHHGWWLWDQLWWWRRSRIWGLVRLSISISSSGAASTKSWRVGSDQDIVSTLLQDHLLTFSFPFYY